MPQDSCHCEAFFAEAISCFRCNLNRNQESPAVPGTGVVDPQETRRMIGSGVASAAAPATTPATPGAPPAVAANAPAGAPAAANAGVAPTAPGVPGAVAPGLLPAGTTVEVRMIELVDSGRDPAGKQYRASINKAIKAGDITIPQGAASSVRRQELILPHSRQKD